MAGAINPLKEVLALLKKRAVNQKLRKSNLSAVNKKCKTNLSKSYEITKDAAALDTTLWRHPALKSNHDEEDHLWTRPLAPLYLS